MSTKPNTTRRKSIHAPKLRPPTIVDVTAGAPMKGADIVAACLEREGVDLVFGYPGGASMEMHQTLTRIPGIRVVLPRHEQGECFAAIGYARSTGKVGVCLATSGPGATNLVTGIADAYMDSVPIVAITGQVHQAMIGKSAFQETDVIGVTRPIVKHSHLVQDVRDIPRVMHEAFYIARSGRPGPVVIDIPKDVQQASAHVSFPDEIHLPGYSPEVAPHPRRIEEIVRALKKSRRPLIYCGGGIISGHAHDELRRFVEITGVPVTTTLMGVGAFPEDHPLSLKWLGMHGAAYANYAVAECDLLLALGVRFDDRVTGKVEEFAKGATIVHIDIDASEINKNRVVDIPVVADIKLALQELLKLVEKKDLSEWHARLAELKRAYPLRYKESDDAILPQFAIQKLYELTRGDAIITTGVGQHQMWAGQWYTYRHPRTFITSAGLGSMGYGLPAAMGAKLGNPDKMVVNIDGDGSFQMNIQELATVHIEKIGVKTMILNNQHLGMVVQWEDRFYEGNRGHTFIGDPASTVPYPDFATIARGYGVKSRRVMKKEELVPALREMLADPNEPYLLDVIIPHQEHVLPMIPAGKTVREMIIE
ncbi:biosynthetic-type acetolactate synthase large subunit [bacterium]|nr:biosynthetic-type acetolactate synthase large subunit [bacterium]